MGTTETTIDQSRDLTIVKSTGKMSAYDFYEWIRDYYAGTVTQLIIWELTDADMSNVSITDVLRIVTYLKQVAADKRKGGKTVFVADHDGIAVPLSKYQQIFLEMSDLGIEMNTFHHMDEAMEWLGL
jgi:hypothetical protein